MAKILTLLMFGKQYALSTDRNEMIQATIITPKVNGEIETSKFVGANVGMGLGCEVGVADGNEEGILVGYFCWITIAEFTGAGLILTLL